MVEVRETGTGTGAVAIGNLNSAVGNGAIALGNAASANGAGAVAIGSGAVATMDGQVALRGSDSTYTFAGLNSAESAARQSGPVSLVTTDAAGNLGVSTLDIGLLQSTAGRIGSLEGRVDTLFDLAAVERRETNRGIAAAVALTPAPMPSEVGRVSYAANASVYRGELGLGASVAARVNSDTPLAVTMGVSYSGGKNTAARVGVAGSSDRLTSGRGGRLGTGDAPVSRRLPPNCR